MLINLTELFTREGKTNDYAVELDCRGFQIPQGICPVSDSKPVTFYIENVGDRTLVLSGEAEFTLMIPCDRCLEPVEVPFQLSIERTLGYEPDRRGAYRQSGRAAILARL